MIIYRFTSCRIFFTKLETLPLPVKNCQIYAYARRTGSLSREGSLSCHACCDTGPRFFRCHPKDRPIQSPLTTHEGMWRIYSSPDPHGVNTTVRRRCRHFGWDRMYRVQTSQQVCYEIEPSLLEAVNATCKYWSKFAPLSPVMVTAARQLKNCSCSYKQANKQEIIVNEIVLLP
jgi:hypothetical protein